MTCGVIGLCTLERRDALLVARALHYPSGVANMFTSGCSFPLTWFVLQSEAGLVARLVRQMLIPRQGNVTPLHHTLFFERLPGSSGGNIGRDLTRTLKA